MGMLTIGRRAFIVWTDYSVEPQITALPLPGVVFPNGLLFRRVKLHAMGFQNIVDANGLGLALTGMAIVFVVLVLVSVFIAWLPRLLPVVNGILPPVEHHHHGPPMPSSAPVSAERQPSLEDEDEIVAAIGFAIHHARK